MNFGLAEHPVSADFAKVKLIWSEFACFPWSPLEEKQE